MKPVQFLNKAMYILLIALLLPISTLAQNTVINGNRSIVGTLCVGSSVAAVDSLSICKAPVAAATRALLNLSNTALSGGSAAGTYIGANPAACTGDFINFQLANAARATLTCAGALTIVSSTNNLSVFAATTSAQLAGVLSNETGTGLVVFGTSPTINSPVIANIVPGADFSFTQNTIPVFSSIEVGAIVNTLYLSAGTLSNGIAGTRTDNTSGLVYRMEIQSPATVAATLEPVALFNKNGASKAGAAIRVHDTLVDYGAEAYAGAGEIALSLSTLTGGVNTEQFRIASTGAITIKSTFKSTATADLGWTIQNAANQACNTTCTTGACVAGLDTAAVGNFLACTDATADTCLCAG